MIAILDKQGADLLLRDRMRAVRDDLYHYVINEAKVIDD